MNRGGRARVLIPVSLFGFLAFPGWGVLGHNAYASRFAVFVVAGQSNAVGYGANAADLPPGLQSPQTDVQFWYEVGPYNSVDDPTLRIRSDGFVPMQHQTDSTGATFGGLTNGFGPELMLGNALADSLDWNFYYDWADSIAVIKFAINATTLAVDWNPATPGSLYHQMVALVDTAVTTLQSRGHIVSVEGMLWMHGEWDAQNEDFALDYEQNLREFICQVRTQWNNPKLVFTVGRLAASLENSCCYSFPYLNTVRNAQSLVGSSVRFVHVVNTDDFSQNVDSVHFSAYGQLSLGFMASGEQHWFNAFAESCVPCEMGDVQSDGVFDVLDVVGTIAVAFRSESNTHCAGYFYLPVTDGNCDGATNILDVIGTIDVAFRGVTPSFCQPCDCTYYPSNCVDSCAPLTPHESR